MKKMAIIITIILSAILKMNSISALTIYDNGSAVNLPDPPSGITKYVIGREYDTGYYELLNVNNYSVYSYILSQYLPRAQLIIEIENNGNPQAVSLYRVAAGQSDWQYVRHLRGFDAEMNPNFLATNVDIYDYNNRNTMTYSAYTGLQQPRDIRVTEQEEQTYSTLTIDFSDYITGDYIYKVGYDSLYMPTINDDLVSGVYTMQADYRDNLIIAVLEQDNTLVDELIYTISNTNLARQYSLHFHAENGYSRDFVKYVNDNTVYDSNFFDSGERLALYLQPKVAIGFYTDMSLTNEIAFDGTICFDYDAEIYVKWSPKIPTYTKNIYVSEDKINLDLTFTEWLSEAQDLNVSISWRSQDSNYSWIYNYSRYNTNHTYTATDLATNTEIQIKWYYLENGHAKYIRDDTFSVQGYLYDYGTDELREEIELISQAENIEDSSDALDAFNNFINIISVPLNFIKNIIAYLYNSLNLHTKIFLVGVFVAKLLTTLGKRLIKR